MISGPATHLVWLNWKANGSNSTGRACQAEICTLRAKRGGTCQAQWPRPQINEEFQIYGYHENSVGCS